MKKQVFNPFLPLWEYTPDGEPHVFGDRLYLFGSHDTEGGERYCAEGNYVGWSAPLDDLSDWRYEGIIYESKQDPRVRGDFADLYAPDVVRGNDGRYYLYYHISGGIGNVGDDHNTAVGVAVCDTPAGKYQFHGHLRNPDGTPFVRYLPGDPAVINDNGVIRLYYGWSLSMVAAGAHGGEAAGRSANEKLAQLKKLDKQAIRHFLVDVEKMMFHRTKEQLLADKEDVMGANHAILADDMLTVISEPTRIVPGQFMSFGTRFEGHAFYEASSIRKIGDLYYFIYSDENSNMLSYATSKYPDRDFVYRGIIHSNGDVGLNGREGKDRLNMTANNHGSIECVNGQWYIFGHRHTHNSTYSRQAVAEPITIEADGTIRQAECTSCGLNGGPLVAEGSFPAAIACNITNGAMPYATNRILNADIPYVTHEGEGENALRFITNMKDGCKAVFKYFHFNGNEMLKLVSRGDTGSFEVYADDTLQGTIPVGTDASVAITATGTHALTLRYCGEGAADLLEILFS